MTTIKLKNGSGAPTAGDLVQGEPALDLTNKRLYTENASGTVIEVGTNPTSITTGDITATGTATFANLATSGDVTFGDNDKAIFGAGSDLQIYHDGSNSFITENGTGYLGIGTNGSKVIINKSPFENMAEFITDGAVNLYHNNVQKFATTATGIDVTGTVTADGATIDGAMTINGAGINLDDAYSLTWGDGSAQVRGSGSSEAIDLRTANTTRLNIDADGDVSLYNSAGTSQDLFWDASESRLGLGTTSPQKLLDVSSNSAPTIRISNTRNDTNWDVDPVFGALEFYSADGSGSGASVRASIKAEATNEFGNATEMVFRVGNDLGVQQERIRIDNDGNVGINNSNPDARLDVTSESVTDVAIKITDAQAETAGFTGYNVNMITKYAEEQFTLYSSDTYRSKAWIGFDNFGQAITFGSGAGTERMVINSSGNVGISNTAPLENLHIGDGTSPVALTLQGTDAGTNAINMGDATNRLAGRILYDNSLNDFRFVAGGSERVRIKGSGDLLVGCTSTPSATVNGFGVNPAGVVRTSRSGTTTASHYIFYNDNGDVGSIDTSGTSTSYTTSSDRRLKDNIVDAPSASDDIDAIQVRSFDWKADGSHQKYGMVAQELQTVAPEAVSKGDTEDDMMSVDYSKLVPMLVKEIQSLRARVAQLEGAN